MTARKPAQPPHLDTAGRSLWRSVIGAYDLRADELVVLTHACRTADLLGRIQEAMAGQLTTPGASGQMRPHPLLVEARQQRLALASMLKQLRLPDDPGAARAVAGGQARSVQARAAARARWSKHRDGSGRGA